MKYAVDKLVSCTRIGKDELSDVDKAKLQAYDNVIRYIEKAENEPAYEMTPKLEVPVYITNSNDLVSYDKILEILRWDKTGLPKPIGFKIVAIENITEEAFNKMKGENEK